jgi:hypothetical protein
MVKRSDRLKNAFGSRAEDRARVDAIKNSSDPTLALDGQRTLSSCQARERVAVSTGGL